MKLVNLTHYEPDVDKIIRALFHKGAIDRRALLSGIMRTQQTQLDMLDDVLESRIITPTGQLPISREQTEEILVNAGTQMIWEATALFRGVSVQVEDRNLVEAMVRTDIDALMGDVQLPFPICEFMFPPGIPIGVDDFTMPGVLLCDLSFNLTREWSAFGPLWVQRLESRSCGYQMMTRLTRSAGVPADRDGVSWIRFDTDTPLDDLPTRTVLVDPRESVALRKVVRIVFGLCLYLQTQEGRSAIEPREPTRRRNLCAATARALRRRPSVGVKDLITHKFSGTGGGHGGHHGSPAMHWRRLHMRSLRSEKYKRNEDGSIRVIWVKPALINALPEGVVNQRRRIRGRVQGSDQPGNGTGVPDLGGGGA